MYIYNIGKARKLQQNANIPLRINAINLEKVRQWTHYLQPIQNTPGWSNTNKPQLPKASEIH